MRKGLLILAVAVLAMLQTAWAYDFSATSPSGHTLYYEIISGTTNVGVVRPGTTSTYYNYVSGNVVIPATVTYNGTTYSVTELRSIYNFIGYGAFESCDSLTSVTIPNSVTSIGEFTFLLCRGLTSVIIGSSVTSIGAGAFSQCRRLTSVTIPNSVASIGSSAFRDCASLTSVTIPNSVTAIGYSVFSGCASLTSVTIPNSVTSIGQNAFSNCTGLTSVTIPNSVTSIGQDAFRNCTGLTSVTIPNSVTSIGQDAFYMVRNIIYSGTATGSPWGALSHNGFVEDGFVYVDNTKTLLLAYIGTDTNVVIPNSVISIGSSAFSGCSGLTSITIPDSVTFIGNGAFSGCSDLTSITIPNGITSIGNSTFSGCSGLTSITIPDSVTFIGDGAFYGCSGLTSITIPNSITSIGNSTFSRCSGLTSITIPNSVTYIGEGAFESCTGLTSITISNGVDSIRSSTFRNCTNLTSVTIPNSVTSIGRYAFYGCTGLTSVTIGNNVTYIEQEAFSSCSSLTSVTIGNNVTYIEQEAFSGCSSLTSVTIGNSVRLISYKAFYGCNNLQKVISFAVSRPFLVNEVFSDTVAILKVPCGSANSYSSQWSQYFVNIEEICDSITITATSANDSIGIVSGGGEYEFGASATITATPNEGYSFVSWNDGNTDNPRAITITEDATYIANFAANTYSITVISDNDSMGTVLGGGEYEFETEVTIIAIPNEGYHFVSWNDGNTNNPRIITLTGDTTFIANFTLDNYTVTVTSANDSMGTVSGSGEYVFGTEVTITATPNEGYRFVSWNDGNTDNPRTITVTEDATYIASFEEGVGIESRDMLSELAFYPNPTSGIITFNRNDIMKVEVLDAMGRTLEVYENAYTIDISKLAKGYYAMRITTAEGVAVRKVIRK